MTRPAAAIAVLGAALALVLFALRGSDRRDAPRAPGVGAGGEPEAVEEASELEPARGSAAAALPPAEPLPSDSVLAPPGGEEPPGLPAPSAPSGAALLFRVVDARTYLPLETFEVRLGRHHLRPLLNDEGRIRLDFPDGQVRFPGVIEGLAGESVTLSIAARGFEELRLSELYIAPGRDLDLGTLRMQRGPRITVHVLDEASGKAVAGARVTLINDRARPPYSPSGLDPWSASTDRDGRVLLTSLPGEPARLWVRHPEHAPHEVELVLPLADEHHETVRLRPPERK